jgi:hypothetical protein
VSETLSRPPTSTPISPYRGLAPYGESDTLFFFGRDAECEIVVANLTEFRLTLLYGPSGVGKSSLLRAAVVPRLRELGRPITVFTSWGDGDLVRALERQLREAVVEATGEGPSARPPSDALAPSLREFGEQVHGSLYVILDQFEEYFLYHPDEEGEGTFASEFPAVLRDADIPTNFLISIREDALAKLDWFKGEIENLFSNYLRIKHLDHQQAREAIERPLERLNELEPTLRTGIEPALVEAVVNQVSSGRIVIGAGAAAPAVSDRQGRVEVAYLQLVMSQLWGEEIHRGSHVLCLQTLLELGGAEALVRRQFDEAMAAFSPEERASAASIFRYLVTPSGERFAYAASDLAAYSGIPESALLGLLERLAGGGLRILRPVEPPLDQPGAWRYEIFHEALVAPILDWRARHESERARHEQSNQKRLVRALWLAVGVLALLLVLMTVVALLR